MSTVVRTDAAILFEGGEISQDGGATLMTLKQAMIKNPSFPFFLSFFQKYRFRSCVHRNVYLDTRYVFRNEILGLNHRRNSLRFISSKAGALKNSGGISFFSASLTLLLLLVSSNDCFYAVYPIPWNYSLHPRSPIVSPLERLSFVQRSRLRYSIEIINEYMRIRNA